MVGLPLTLTSSIDKKIPFIKSSFALPIMLYEDDNFASATPKNNKKAINSVYKILDIANPLLLSINIISYHSFNIITFFKRKNHIFYKYGFTLDIYPYNITKVIICVLIIRFLKGFLGR